jgi:hypothetical protein
MAQFNREKVTVEDSTEDMVFAAIYQGISPDEPLMKKLFRKQSSTLQGLMDKVEEFINQEETLKSMDSSRLRRETAPENKMKEFRKADGEEQAGKEVQRLQFYTSQCRDIRSLYGDQKISGVSGTTKDTK